MAHPDNPGDVPAEKRDAAGQYHRSMDSRHDNDVASAVPRLGPGAGDAVDAASPGRDRIGEDRTSSATAAMGARVGFTAEALPDDIFQHGEAQ